MELLDFARSTGMQWALIILTLGMLWRVIGALLLAREADYSKARVDGAWKDGIRAVFTRFWHHKEFVPLTLFHIVAGFTLHIGLLVVIFLFGPHIAFINDLTGLNWSGLPNDVVMVFGVIAGASLVAFLIRRLTHPVMKTISGFDDYASNLLTLLPIITGIMAYGHVWLAYETLLALHLLSVELLMIWIPFSKLSHMLLFMFSRYQLGAAFGRRGVKV